MVGIRNASSSTTAKGALLSVLAVALVGGLGGLMVDRTSAEGTPSPDFSIEIDVDGDTTPDCDTRGSPPEGSCTVRAGHLFTVDVYLNQVEGMPDHDGDGEHGYTGFRVSLSHPEPLVVQDRPGDGEFRDADGEPFWADLGPPGCFEFDGVDSIVDTLAYVGACEIFFGGVESFYTGKLMEVDFLCPTSGLLTVTMITEQLGATSLVDDVNKQGFGNDANDKGAPEVLMLSCTPPWDVTGDGVVTVGDILVVVLAFGETVPPAAPELDVDGDGTVTIGDILQVVMHFGETVS